ncbi:hypothetical protein Tco_0493900 [Tanacetum coccineum]
MYTEYLAEFWYSAKALETLRSLSLSPLAMDSNPSETSASTPVLAEMHKEDQQANAGPTSLGVTSEARANPQLSSGLSTFNLNKPIYSASFIIHSESVLENDASAVSTAEADPRKSTPSDFVPQQQGIIEGTKNTSYDHLFAGTDPPVLADKTQSVEEDEASRTIKLEDLVKLVSSVQPSFKDLDSLEDDHIIVVNDSDKDEEADKVYDNTNVKTKDTLVPKSSSPRSSQIQELTNQVFILQFKKHKLELEAEAALLKAQPSIPNVRQLNELLVKSLQTGFLKILFAHDFSSSLPTELKELPSKFNELTKEVKGLKKQVHEIEFKLPGDLKEIPSKLEDFTKTVTIEKVQAKLKTLDALPSLLNKVTNAFNQFAQAIASKKTEDIGIPSAGQAGTQPAEEEKYTNQTTISQLFQRKVAKNAN